MYCPEKEISVTVVQAVFVALDAPVNELPPVTDAIDPDALEAVVSNDPPSDVTVTFSYAGRRVVVLEGKTVYVRPEDGEPKNQSGMAPFSN